jgi:hypothetical protein
MKQEHIDKWVKALRSEKYKQTDQMLRDGDKFCCLGVACDIFKDEAAGEWQDDVFVNKDNPEDESACVLPPFMYRFLGISDSGNLTSNGAYPLDSLAGINDAGASFDVIANSIENRHVKTINHE